jgi:hypothetical protein
MKNTIYKYVLPSKNDSASKDFSPILKIGKKLLVFSYV